MKQIPWPTKKLGDRSILTMGSGGTPSRSNFSYYNGNTVWLKSGELNDNQNISDSEEKISEIAVENSSAKIFPTNTILFAMYGATAGKLGVLSAPATTNQAVAGMICNEKVLYYKYLYNFLLNTREKIINKAWGGAQPNLSQAIIKNFEIPLPPLEIQKKIVKKIEELFAKIVQAQSLREVSVQDTNNIVSSALEQILHKSSGWKEFTIGQLADDIQSGFACGKSNEVSDGIVHLRTHNIDLNGELNMDKVVKIPKNLVNNNAYGLKKGDILFNNTNSTELVGKTIIIREDLPYAFSNHLNRVRFNASIVMPEWILFVFQKYWRDKYFESICTRWVGQSGINQGKLVTIKVPVPPLAEQRKIVAQLDALTQKVRQLQTLQSGNAADLSTLKQSILHQAFQGEL